MELYVFSPAWGLASPDPDCLEILTLAKVSGCPIKVRNCNNPFWTSKGRLPVLYSENRISTEFNEIFFQFDELHFNADYRLSPKQIAELYALRKMVETSLKPALHYVMWVDSKNFAEMSRPWFSSKIPFPLGIYYIPKFRQDAIFFVSSVYNYIGHDEISEDRVLQTLVFTEAQRCLTILDNRLSRQKPFLFGASPSSLDATLYSVLAPLLRAPFPNAALQNYAKQCENLVQFVDHVSNNYYSQIKIDFEKKMKKDTNPDEEDEDHDAMFSKKNVFFASLFASLAMIGFAYHAGYVPTFLIKSPSDDVFYIK